MMRLFSKKSDSEDEEESEASSKKKRRRSKKKEAKKPWGKKERLSVLVLIILTVGTSSVLALSARAWKLPNIPRLKAPSFTIPFLKEETIILGGDSQGSGDEESARKIIDQFKNATDSLSGVYGLYIVRLGTNYSYGVNAEEEFQAASLIKLPVMTAAYLKAENDEIDLDEDYVLQETDKLQGAGNLRGKEPGYTLSYRDMLRLMGQQSDNTAFNIIRKELGDDYINEVTVDIGMQNTLLKQNTTTPKDIGDFFRKLYDGNLLIKSNKDELLENLTDTAYEKWLSAGVPGNIRVAHKYGAEIHVINDAGIVYAKEPYVIVIMSKGVVESEANDIFPRLSEMVYEAETGSE